MLIESHKCLRELSTLVRLASRDMQATYDIIIARQAKPAQK